MADERQALFTPRRTKLPGSDSPKPGSSAAEARCKACSYGRSDRPTPAHHSRRWDAAARRRRHQGTDVRRNPQGCRSSASRKKTRAPGAGFHEFLLAPTTRPCRERGAHRILHRRLRGSVIVCAACIRRFPWRAEKLPDDLLDLPTRSGRNVSFCIAGRGGNHCTATARGVLKGFSSPSFDRQAAQWAFLGAAFDEPHKKLESSSLDGRRRRGKNTGKQYMARPTEAAWRDGSAHAPWYVVPATEQGKREIRSFAAHRRGGARRGLRELVLTHEPDSRRGRRRSCQGRSQAAAKMEKLHFPLARISRGAISFTWTWMRSTRPPPVGAAGTTLSSARPAARSEAGAGGRGGSGVGRGEATRLRAFRRLARAIHAWQRADALLPRGWVIRAAPDFARTARSRQAR